MGSLKTGHDGSSGTGADGCGDVPDGGHDDAERWRLRGRFLMTAVTVRGAAALAVAGGCS